MKRTRLQRIARLLALEAQAAIEAEDMDLLDKLMTLRAQVLALAGEDGDG